VSNEPGDDVSPQQSPDTAPDRRAWEAATKLRELTGGGFHTAVVLGSGWVPAADAFGSPSHELAVTALPGFPPPAVSGHAGRLRAVEVGGRRCLLLLGRTHLYEGRGVDTVVHSIRTALAAGVSTVILTNAAGGLRPEWQQVGDPVLIADHINLTGHNPLTGPQFVDLTETYSGRLRALARSVDADLAEGVYASLPGPSYETPAEIRMLRVLGADLVGMSTVPEAITARAGGAAVLGISLVTNIAAGLTGEPLDHQDVLAAGRASAARMGSLLAEVVTRL
jgi:purine-nucleoside phosphorylase